VKRVTLILFLISIIATCSFAQNDTVIIEKSKDKVIIGGQLYYVHIVKKGETLFSLSNAYEVTQKEIATENPEIFLGLQLGQALKIPAKDVKDDESKISSTDFIYHRVKRKQTVYSLSKKYNVTQADIFACNPSSRYGINENQIIKIPKSKEVVDAFQQFQVNDHLDDTLKMEDQYIYHKVVKDDTEFSIKRLYAINKDILYEHNPFLSNGLKLDQTLKIPKVIGVESTTVLIRSDEELGDTIIFDKRDFIAYSDSIQNPDCNKLIYQREPFQVALLLPLYLEKNDEEFYVDSSEVDDFGKKIYEKIYYEPFYVYPRSKAFVEFYEGFLMAVDSLKQRGLSINLHVYDTQNDTARIKEIISFPEFENTNLIIGPIYNQEVKVVSEFSREHQIKMISPIYDNLTLVNENPYLFQVYPSYISQIDEFAKFVSGFSDKNIILVHNADSIGYSNIQMVKEKLFKNLSVDTLVNNIQFKEVAFIDSINVLEHALSEEIENVFIVPSNEEAFVTDVVTNLYTLKTYGYNVRVIGLSRWQRFGNIDPEYYFNLDLCIAAPFFIDYHDNDVKKFVLKYRSTFKTEPDQMAIHGYDVGLYFLSALMNYGNNFEGCIYNHNIDLLQANYKFVKWYRQSGYENIGVDIIKYYEGYNIYRIDSLETDSSTELQMPN
jgi:LysM repeat protein